MSDKMKDGPIDASPRDLRTALLVVEMLRDRGLEGTISYLRGRLYEPACPLCGGTASNPRHNVPPCPVCPSVEAPEPAATQEDPRIEKLRSKLCAISLASQNSMSSKEECGRIAREALYADDHGWPS